MKYKLSDEVLGRIVQIIQEAMIVGLDCVDLMRMIELQSSADNESVLELCEDYRKRVEDMHEAWLKKARELQQNTTASSDDETVN
jgi:hypothetical protein